jgi:rod shape-determining protein MreD
MEPAGIVVMLPTRARVLVLVLTAIVVQTAALSRLRPAGVVPDLPVLLAIGVGLVGGPDRGAATGFSIGLLFDLFLETPLGLSALVFSIVGFAAGIIGQNIVRASRWIPVVAAAAGSAVAEVLFALTGSVVGEEGLVAPRLALVAVVVALANLVLAPLVLRSTTWALADDLGVRG